MTNIGTPDWQYGVVSAGTLLASEPSTSSSVSVDLPPNASTLMVFTEFELTLYDVKCVGNTTGVEYPGLVRAPAQGIQMRSVVLFDVASQVDSSVTITLFQGPATPWYVYSSSGTHVVDVPELAMLVVEESLNPHGYGIMALGSDGAEARYLSTDSSGKLQVVIANMPNPATTVTGPDAYGDPAVVGISADYARGDHDHGLPAASSSAPLSVTQYGPTTDPAYAISTTAMTAVDYTNLTTSSFTVPASGKIKVTVSGVVNNASGVGQVFLAMLNRSGGAQLGPTSCVAQLFGTSTYEIAFTKTYVITGLSAGSLQLDLAMHCAVSATLHAIESATPADTDLGPVTIIVEAA